MFFMFLFLLLPISFSEINNFVLKKDREGDPLNVKHNHEDLIFQDAQNVTVVIPTRKSVLHVRQKYIKTYGSNLKSNRFNEKLSNEIPIKRHIQENDDDDPPSVFKSTKSSTSILELRRKWPVVEFLSHSDDFTENSQYFDEFEKKEFPFPHDIDKHESKVTGLPPKIHSHLDLPNNISKDKSVGLRSLTHRKFPGISCEDGDQCVCRLPGVSKPATISVATSTRPCGSTCMNMGFSMGLPFGVPMGVPMGIPASYPAGYAAGYPVGYPAPIPAGPAVCMPGSPCYYQPKINNEVPKHKKPCKTHSEDYLYYDDDVDDDDSENIHIHDVTSKKRKHEKIHKGDILIDVQYNIEDNYDHKPNRNSKWQHNQKDLATDIYNDLRKSYGDTVIKNCYCCSGSSCGIKFQIVFLLLLLLPFC